MAANNNNNNASLQKLSSSATDVQLPLTRKKTKSKVAHNNGSDNNSSYPVADCCGSTAAIGDFGHNVEETEEELKITKDQLQLSEERIPSTTVVQAPYEQLQGAKEESEGYHLPTTTASSAELEGSHILSSIPKECQVCFETCDLICKSCQKVYYCSKNHQVSDWPRHKHDCFPALVSKNKDGERILIATKDIPQDGQILKEKPFLIVPSTTESCDHVCLGCYEEVETSVSCSRCKWDVCSVKCEKSSLHSTNECHIFAIKKVLPPVACNAIHLMDAVAVLRCLLLKERDSEKWRRFISLNSVCRTDPQLMLELDHRLNLENCIKFIRTECGLRQFDEALIERVHKCLLRNKMHAPGIPATIRDCRRVALLFKNFYVPGTLCIPNARWAVGGRQNMKYFGIIGASIEIKKGQEIHCDFTQSLTGTYIRREIIRTYQDRVCKCQRCRDPTEYGTYLTAMRCRDNPSCSGGSVLPENPLDNCTAWRCDKCGDMVDASYVVTKINRVNDELMSVGGDIDDSALKELDRVIKKYKSSVLHENHFLIMSAEYDYCHRVMQLSTHLAMYEMKAVWGEKVVDFSKHLLQVTENIMPGLHRYKGRIIYCLHIGLLISIFGFQPNMTKKRVSALTKRYRQKKYDETMDAQRLALQFLNFEPVDTDEGDMVRILNDKLTHSTSKDYIP